MLCEVQHQAGFSNSMQVLGYAQRLLLEFLVFLYAQLQFLVRFFQLHHIFEKGDDNLKLFGKRRERKTLQLKTPKSNFKRRLVDCKLPDVE
jgi:hypothetical protein